MKRGDDGVYARRYVFGGYCEVVKAEEMEEDERKGGRAADLGRR